jgi:hypothetical protein
MERETRRISYARMDAARKILSSVITQVMTDFLIVLLLWTEFAEVGG